MKKTFVLLAICLFSAIFSNGQCVIYACDKTGAFGAGFNNDNAATTFKECEDYAIRVCKEKGGKTCTELYRSSKKGWWALINGQKADGRNFFQGGDGYPSKDVAEREVRKKYKNDGGVNAENIQVYTWYSYSNVKN